MNPRAVKIAAVFSAVVWGVVLAALVLWLVGCASPTTVAVPIPPAWQSAQDARPVTGYEVTKAVQAVAPIAVVRLQDDTYTRASYPWLERYTSWTWEAYRTVGLRYTPESFDCENFARLFNEVARAVAARSGLRMAPLFADVIVTDGARRHCVVGVFTDRGFFIVDPQPDAGPFRIKPVEAYRGRIVEVDL